MMIMKIFNHDQSLFSTMNETSEVFKAIRLVHVCMMISRTETTILPFYREAV